MSGQLVGEVLAASHQLQARGLSKRGFHALIAIAEKALTDTRQGSVRWDHIRAALYDGASLRTAERAVQDLKRAGIVTVVRPGFNNNHGRAAAPIYEIQALSDTDTHVAESVGSDTDTHVAESEGAIPTNQGGDTDKTDTDPATQASDLTVLYDGSPDGGSGRLDDEPRCARHRDTICPPPCIDCKRVREQRDAERQDAAEWSERERLAIRQAIDACDDCDDYGRPWLADDPNAHCPRHPNFRQKAAI
ncbi:hypothetical protein MycrhDRAFT_4253 [Mycolicibacterium rhodesiae JS60]|nr:hypothetical protein MycrhDRAFT_4253 [Mycolicibacterium rhodesiae JS60]